MEIIKYILGVIYILVCLTIIILTLLQKKGQEGLSGAIVGTATAAGAGNFYEKNKGRTKEGSMKRWTVIMGIVFAILTIVLGIVYVIK